MLLARMNEISRGSRLRQFAMFPFLVLYLEKLIDCHSNQETVFSSLVITPSQHSNNINVFFFHVNIVAQQSK